MIRNLVDVDDVSLAIVPEIGKFMGDYFRISSLATVPEIPLMWLKTASIFPQRGRDDAAQRR